MIRSLWHVMQYYSHYGHRDFVLCLGYKANVIKELLPRCIARRTYSDCVISDYRQNSRTSGRAASRTGVSRSSTPASGETLASAFWAVRHSGRGEENFSRQLQRRSHRCAADEMIDRFKGAERSAVSSQFIRLQLSSCRIRRTGRVSAFGQVMSPISGSMAAISSFEGKFSTISGRAKSSCSSRSADLSRRAADGLQIRGILARDGYAEGPAGARGDGRKGRDAVARQS